MDSGGASLLGEAYDGIGDAVMPMSLGLGTADDEGNEVFDFIEGLAKGVRLPASGVISGLHTQKAMRPGILEDEIRMSLYQLDEPFEKGKKGPRAFFTKHLYDIILTGEDIPNLLPEDSEVNIRMHAERSGTIDSFIFYNLIEEKYGKDILTEEAVKHVVF